MSDALKLRELLEWELLDILTSPAPTGKLMRITHFGEQASRIKLVKLLRELSATPNSDYPGHYSNVQLGLKEAVDLINAAQIAAQLLPSCLQSRIEELRERAHETGTVLEWE
jgi:hypothetical protein